MTAAHLPIETVVRPRLPVDLRLTLGPLRRGPRDPTILVDKAGAWWRATRTPLGPATARYSAEGDGIRVAACPRPAPYGCRPGVPRSGR
ncbi:MAG TPA: hypothetical protein VFS70_05370 [Actinomycetota bacterium]|nr:hypothetical protein [Actinomycetota bacterium]